MGARKSSALFPEPARVRGSARCALRALALFAVLLPWTAACTPAPPAPRHLILVTLDTLRSDRLGAYGYERPTTPQLDALAARGVRFEDAVAQAISTPPSHASILTGLNPPSHGLRRLSGQRLAPENVTLAEVLRDAGFRTAAFVSGVPLRRALGLDQGFEVYDDAVGEAGERPAGETVARVRAWLPEAGERRLFLWVHFFDPHMPYFAPPEWRARFHPEPVGPEDVALPRATNRLGRPGSRVPAVVMDRMSDLYDAEVAYTDDQVGALLAALDEAGFLDDAVVAVVADHGECLGERGYYFGHWDVWRTTAQVPMLLVHPDGRSAGRAIAPTVRTLDLMPTVLAWLGVEAPAGLEGRDLTPLIEGRDDSPRLAYTEQLEYFPARAVREGRFMLVEHGFDPESPVPQRARLFGRTPGAAAQPVIAAPEETRAHLRSGLGEAIAPAHPRPTLALGVEADVAEQLRALGYVVEPPGGSGGDAP